jgi:hypothetical protein
MHPPHLSPQEQEDRCKLNLGLLDVSDSVVNSHKNLPRSFTCCFLDLRCSGAACCCSLLAVGPSSGDKARFPKATRIQVSSHIVSSMHKNTPDLVVTAPRGTLIVSEGKSDLCAFFFLSFFKRAEVSVEGTTEAASVVVFRRHVLGAMLIWQDNGQGKTQDG